MRSDGKTAALVASPEGVASTLPEPTWTHDDRPLAGVGRRLIQGLGDAFERWVVCRGSKVAFLRR